MKKTALRIYKSLSLRLFAVLVLIMLILFLVYSTWCGKLQKGIQEDTIAVAAQRIADVVAKSMYRDMLQNERDGLHQTILLLGAEPGMERIRILNKKGEIKFSTSASEAGHVVDMHEEACYGCHSENKPIASLPLSQTRRIYHHPNGDRVMGLIKPIRNAPECANNDCHAHESTQTILGVLDVQMSLRALDLAHLGAKQMVNRITLIFFFLSMFFFGIIVYQVIYRPVAKLQEGTENLAEGNLNFRIELQREDELGKLAQSFNQMAGNLHTAYSSLRNLSNNLQDKVNEKTAELEAVHRRMLRFEKMASLGKLSATVAHELNNPLAGIVTYAKLLGKKIQKRLPESEDSAKILREINLIREESLRCGNIVRNLLLFARGKKANISVNKISEILSRSVQIVQHHMLLSGVNHHLLNMSIHEEIDCDFDQILQAMVALLVNAVEAMPDGGDLYLEVRDGESGLIEIYIRDTGIGIPPEEKDKIFEPFFSTKKDEKGVGLGLSVVYGIVQRHKGEIRVDSEPGVGTSFKIVLPLKQAKVEEKQGLQNENT